MSSGSTTGLAGRSGYGPRFHASASARGGGSPRRRSAAKVIRRPLRAHACSDSTTARSPRGQSWKLASLRMIHANPHGRPWPRHRESAAERLRGHWKRPVGKGGGACTGVSGTLSDISTSRDDRRHRACSSTNAIGHASSQPSNCDNSPMEITEQCGRTDLDTHGHPWAKNSTSLKNLSNFS